MGVQLNIDVSDQDFDIALWYAQQLGIKWVKFQFVWASMEPEQGVPSQTLYRYRLFVQRARQQGFQVMVSIAKAPDWARATQEEDGPPRDPQMLADFLSLLLGEIRVDLYGRSYIDAIEIWNEPNLRREWNGGTLTGGDYMRVFDAAYNAIRAAEGGPGIVVVTAGLAPTGINDGVSATSDRAYLRQMYDAGLGSAKYQNIAVGVHLRRVEPPDALLRFCAGLTRPTFFLGTIQKTTTPSCSSTATQTRHFGRRNSAGGYDGLITARRHRCAVLHVYRPVPAGALHHPRVPTGADDALPGADGAVESGFRRDAVCGAAGHALGLCHPGQRLRSPAVRLPAAAKRAQNHCRDTVARTLLAASQDRSLPEVG
jgi:hypothetical protein